MPNVLYPKFLTNARQYAEAQAYWQKLWHEVLSAAGKLDSWHAPWLSDKHADGTPCRDGNPMFSAVNEAEQLGVRIIQLAPAPQGSIELDYWIDHFGGSAAPEHIRELVISTVLDDEIWPQVRELLFSWVTRGKVKTTRGASLIRPAR